MTACQTYITTSQLCMGLGVHPLDGCLQMHLFPSELCCVSELLIMVAK